MPRVSGAAAYQQLEVPQDAISENARHAASLAAANARQQKALNAQKAKEDKADKDKAFKATELPDDAFRTKVTGFGGRDDNLRDFSSTSIDRYTELGEQAREAFGKDDAEYNSLLAQQQKVLQSFDNINEDEQKLTGIFKNYKDLADADRISPVEDEWDDFAEAFASSNFVYELDENQNPQVRVLVTDNEGNEKIITKKKSELESGSYRPYERVELEGKGGLIDEWLVGFGKRVYTGGDGDFKTTTQEWDTKNQVSLDSKLDAITGDKRQMADLLYQASGGSIKKKGDPNQYGEDDAYTPADYQLVRDFLTGQVEAAYGEKFTDDFTGKKTSLDIQKGSLAERKRHNLVQEQLARDKAEKGKPLTRKEEEYSIRKYDIGQAIENNDVESFASGDFTWNDKDYTASRAQVINGNLVVTTTDGNKIPVRLEERALNDLYNAYEGKKLNFDSVMSINANEYRPIREGSVSQVDDILSEFYSADGEVLVDDEDIIKSIKQAFGAKVSDRFTFSGNSLKVNGVNVDTSNEESLRRTLTQALKDSDNDTTQPTDNDPLGLGFN